MTPNEKRALAAFLVLLGCAAFFFYHFGHSDDRKMAEFSVAYGEFDRAVSELSARPGPDSERRADAASAGLIARAAMRLSSLTKNDAELMTQARQVAEIAARELESQKSFLKAAQKNDREADALARTSRELAGRRRAAWDHFRQLAGQGSDR